MKCPKCAGLLVQEELQEQTGHFEGLRCIQCGMRLDATILQNRLETKSVESAAPIPAPVSGASTPNNSRATSRAKRSATGA
jgi:hypothetical protein